ncbi:c-type cytochrome [Geothrix terrae]|uniref:c-type cytochrome n=1 Tax=Geothrix terrae TaxID=2922720 RepID=UPI001FADF794|nr:cytochrome c [Geothrix terrae]
MSLRTLPSSERAFATFVVLALGAFLAGGLAFAAKQERPAAAAPPARSRLITVLEGVMAPNTNPAQVAVFRTWVQGGATREGFAPVEAIVANNCASCHGDGGQYPRLTSYEDLRPLALEETSESLYATIGARGLHLAAFPLVFLAVAVLYLRRITWPGRHLLMGGCAVAVLFDATLWWMRQGHPGTAWAPWVALGLLAAAYLAAAAFVLMEVWRGPDEESIEL